MTDTSYATLRKVNVNDRIEKKNGLSYLSWAFAVDTLLQHDSQANWSYPEPKAYGDTLMVFCSVTAFDTTRTAQLPVMDYKNKAIPNPDAFAVNTAMQRCLVKAIALHGLGLYIYAGEDLPDADPTHGSVRDDITRDMSDNELLQAKTTAENMQAIMDADLEEQIKALHVADLHDVLRTQTELYTAAASVLSPKYRTAWKAYVKIAQDAAKREPVNGRGR